MCHFKIATNEKHCRRWGNSIPSARPVNPLKERNFSDTTM
jgi:hypothetical protein